MPNEKSKRAYILMNRMKSISLEEVEEGEEWYGATHPHEQRQQHLSQHPQQHPQHHRMNRQPSLNSKWRLASKHLLGGSSSRGGPNSNQQSMNPLQQTSQNMVTVDPPQQQGVAGEPIKLFPSQPKPQEETLFPFHRISNRNKFKRQ